MIKRISKYYIWIIVSLVIQLMVLFYINNYYLKVKTYDVDMVKMDKIDMKNESTRISVGAIDVKVSYDSMYISYIIEDTLVSKGLGDDDSERVVYKLDENEEFQTYRWLPDRDIIIYTVKEDNLYSSNIKVITYDVENEIEKQFPVLEGFTKKSYVGQIELSTMTNVVYLKLVTNEDVARVYKFNIMNDYYYVKGLRVIPK